MERYRQSMEEFDIHFTAWHQGVTKPCHHRGQRPCTWAVRSASWVADAGICIAASDAQFFDPHVSIGQVGHRGHRPDPQDAGRGGRKHGARRTCERMPADRAYEARHDQRGGRPARAAAGAGAGAGRDRGEELAGSLAATKRGAVGRSSTASPTPLQGGGEDLVSMWGTPTRPRARSPSPRSAGRCGGRRRRGRSGDARRPAGRARPPGRSRRAARARRGHPLVGGRARPGRGRGQ